MDFAIKEETFEEKDYNNLEDNFKTEEPFAENYNDFNENQPLSSSMNTKEFKCDQCNYSTNHKRGLKAHILSIHDGFKPFACEFCDKSFPRNDTLNFHVNSVHSEIKPYKCDICDYSTAYSRNLFRHKYRIHEGLCDESCGIL